MSNQHDSNRDESESPHAIGRKEKVIRLFREQVWPSLVDLGWSKQEDEEGVTLYIPPSIDIAVSTLGKDYFDSVKDVLDRLNERRNNGESHIADAYRREMSKPDPALSPSPPVTRRRRRGKHSNEKVSPGTPSKLDLSWKEGSRRFPKKSSRVGRDYQVSEIPEAGTYKDEKDSLYELVWAPEIAEENGIDLDDGNNILNKVKYNLKEEAYLLLMSKSFDSEEFSKHLGKLKPYDGSDWDEDTRKQFSEEMFRSRKDMNAVASHLKIPMKVCLTYYFGTFKSSDDYRLLKTVCNEERAGRLEALDHDTDACYICGDGGNLLICDGCEKEYHLACLRPRLEIVPEGDWECDECVAIKFLEAKDYLIQKTSLFVEKESRKRKRETMEGSETDTDQDDHTHTLQPAEAVLEAARIFAKAASAALSTPLAIGDTM